MDFEELHDQDGQEDPLLLKMEQRDMKQVYLNNESCIESSVSPIDTIKELGVLHTIQDMKNPECYRFHLFTPILSQTQEPVFLRALKANAHRLQWASFEAVNNTLYLEELSSNLKYLKINSVESPLVLKSLAKAFSKGGNLTNLRGLSLGFTQDCFPVTYFLDSTANLENLLFLRLAGEFCDADLTKISQIIRNNSSLLFLGLHNLNNEPSTIYDVLMAIVDHNGLRTLDLKGTRTCGEFLKELNDCLRNSHSLSQLMVDDSELLVSSLIGSTCTESLFLQALEVSPNNNDGVRRIYKNSGILDPLCSEDDVIVQHCRENLKKQILVDILAKNCLKLAINLKIFSPAIPTFLLARILRLLFTFFSPKHFASISTVMLDRSRTRPIKSPFPFSAIEFLRRCYCLLPENVERDYNMGLIEEEMRNQSAPDYFASLASRRATDTKDTFHF